MASPPARPFSSPFRAFPPSFGTKQNECKFFEAKTISLRFYGTMNPPVTPSSGADP